MKAKPMTPIKLSALREDARAIREISLAVEHLVEAIAPDEAFVGNEVITSVSPPRELDSPFSRPVLKALAILKPLISPSK
jgi:hypothetical protein